MKKYGSLFLIIFLLTCLTRSQSVMAYENPSYKVIKEWKFIEVREYDPVIQAEVTVAGKRERAINAGFRLLADYIFGNNEPKKSIAMTAPVTQQKGEKVVMTAPVTQTQEGDHWKVQFTMPSTYTLETLPKPNNSQVKIISKPSFRVVAIRFSGFWSARSLKKHLEMLDDYAQKNKLKTAGEPIYAFYNPPWTLPFLRRNEILYKLAA